MRNTTIRYFATRDPDLGSHMTLWYRLSRTGELVPYDGQLQLGRARAIAAAKGDEWRAQVVAQIEADPYAAARDFAELGKCCACAKMLRDRDDVTVGIHRTCRDTMDQTEVTAYVAALLAAAGVALGREEMEPAS